MNQLSIGTRRLKLEDVERILNEPIHLKLSAEAISKIKKCRAVLEAKIKGDPQAYYGINTGFGSLCNVEINPTEREQLQLNLIRSHACGSGNTVSGEISKLTLFLKIQNLSLGYSGVREVLVESLVSLFNQETFPVIYEFGSLGASGDLAPLAHLSLLLIGEGEIWEAGQVKNYADSIKFKQATTIQLKEKEGLALINGTQYSTALAAWCCIHGQRLLTLANIIAALSIDVFDCDSAPLRSALHEIRPYKGQQFVAETIRRHLKGSEVHKQTKRSVQDPYSFRCVPQVHGSVYDTLKYAEAIIETEINSVTDNPNIIPDSEEILSGGNFHAQPIAFILDFMAIALSELGSISERRSYQLISGERGLPDYLTDNPGLKSGLMVSQYTAASIASKNKQLSHPASVDSAMTSKGQEDHVSMSANAGAKCMRIVENVYQILGIELLIAAQAKEFRLPRKSSTVLENLVQQLRSKVQPIEGDRNLSRDIRNSVDFLKKIGPKI